MSSVAAQIPPGPSSEPVFRLSVEQYHAMIDARVLTTDDPVELIDGLLIQKMPKKPRHVLVLRRLLKALEAMLPAGYFVQSQESITLRASEPEPDASVIRGNPENFPDQHPGPSQAPLVVEVADATLRTDRGIKLRAYARGGVVAYWIVDLVGRTVEVYANPASRTAQPLYREKRVYGEDSTVPVVIDGRHWGDVDFGALLA